MGRILTKNPYKHFLRGQYFNLKRRYKATCKKEKRKFERKSLQNLENLYTYNNEEFWNLLKEIKGNASNTSPEYQTFPSLNDLDKHYKNLLHKNCNLTKQNFSEPLNTKSIESLNQKMTVEEIKESIKYFKSKKVPGLDNITNEMIKCSDSNMIEHQQTLFNNVMESGYYPTSWNQGLICSIYKLSKKDVPNNYRGITLSNCLGKLFNTILYNRLQNEIQKNIVLSPA